MTSSPQNRAPGKLHPGAARRRAPSIERRLPLLITALLAGALLVSLGMVYLVVRESIERLAAEQLADATEVLGEAASANIAAAKERLHVLAGRAPVRRLLAGARSGVPVDSAVARAALGPFMLGDSTLPVELWSTDGRRLAVVGDDMRPASVGDIDQARPGALPHEGLDDVAPPLDSVAIGTPYAANGAVYYWVVIPVAELGGAPEGYVTMQRRIRGSPALDERLRGLVGDAVTGYYATRDGRLWSTLSGEPIERPSVTGRLVASDTIAGMQAMVVLHQPRSAVLAPVRATFARLSALALVVLAFGAAVAWILGRSISRPLSSLTRAAEAVAQGDYASRVDEEGPEEIVRLAASFNHMAATVDVSRAELEKRVASARALADQLAATNSRLHDANLKLQAAMDEARHSREEAEAASRAKSDFLAVMSHELRTPLNAIGGYAELMAMGIRGPVTESQQRDLERIRASQEHLLGLISAMLDLSRIESGRVRYDLAPVELSPFLLGLDALVEPQATAKSLRLEVARCAPGLAVMTDREKLRQILLNLLSNAIRYTPEGGRIEVGASEREGGGVAITVRDTGVGISEENLERIFEPFVQLDRSLTQVRDGVGLGLAISRDLARAMKGELTVESRVDEGSTFTLLLPAATMAGVPATSPTMEGGARV